MSNTINANSGGVVNTADAAAATVEPMPSAKGLTKAFGHRDTNGDGKLTTADFKNGKIPPGLLKKFDADKNGEISLAEFLNRGHHGTNGKSGQVKADDQKA